MKILFAIIFITITVKLDAKKLSPKRSTMILHHDYLLSYKKEKVNSRTNDMIYSHEVEGNIKIRAAKELLYMFGLKVSMLL